MGESTQSMRPVRCRSSRLENHHIWPVSGGRGPHHGRNDRGPRRVLDTRPLYLGLRPARAHGTPRNIRSPRRQPAAAESRVFSFEAIPFGLPHRPRVGGGSDGRRRKIICCTRDASRPLKSAAAWRMQQFLGGSSIFHSGNGGNW